MALKLISEEGHYQKIEIDRASININGLYVGTIVFKSENDRLKEKDRTELFLDFKNQVDDEFRRLNSLELEEQETLFPKFHKVFHIAQNMEYSVYRIPGMEPIILDEETLIEAEKFGFQRSWVDDPIYIERRDSFLLDDYKKQDFTLETFYTILKDKYQNNGFEVEDI